MKISPLTSLPQAGLSITILAGENGAGKSRYLQSLAKHYANKKVPVVVICNTPFDRFTRMRGVKRVSASRGRRLPLEVLKAAFVAAMADGPTAFRALSKTLDYCGYEPDIGVRIIGLDQVRFRMNFEGIVRDAAAALKADLEQLVSAVAFASTSSAEEISWIDFTSISFDSLRQQSYAVLMKHEVVLRRYGVLKQIELYLRRRDVTIPLLEASSGELTLISTLVYLSVEAKEDGVVLVDEPENSLHPQWQKEYVQRLANLLYYQRSKIFIATHAPVIVSGAETDRDLRLRVFHAMPDHVQELDAGSRSVESTLWTVFQTITPQNHYVSQTISRELSSLANGERTANQITNTINEMRRASYDPQQDGFFNAAMKLADQVVMEVRDAQR